MKAPVTSNRRAAWSAFARFMLEKAGPRRRDARSASRLRNGPDRLLPVPGYSLRALLFFFCGLLAALLLCQPARAAQLRWEALPDRERVTILMGPNEGMAGQVGRIAPTGVLVPFSDVPPGLLVEQAPEGAALFMGSQQLGRSLVLLTQTPAFGFVVSKQEPTLLAIDFFHNALGARWKATAPSPTTEVTPEQGLGPIASPDAATRALESDPQGRSEASAAAAASPVAGASPDSAPDASPDAAQGERPDAASEAAKGEGPEGAQPAASADSPASGTASGDVPVPDAAQSPVAPAGRESDSAPSADSGRPKPVVVELSGSPDYASKVTRMAEAPPVEAASGAMLPQGGEKKTGSESGLAVFAPPQPVLDARSQTAERSAPLPLPEPPLGVASPSGALVAGNISFEPPEIQGAAQSPAQSPALPPPAPEAATTQTPASESQTAAAVPALTQSPESPQAPAAAPALPPRLPGAQSAPEAAAQAASPPAPGADPDPAPQSSRPVPGVGRSLGGALYGGLINTGSLDEAGAATPAATGVAGPGIPAEAGAAGPDIPAKAGAAPGASAAPGSAGVPEASASSGPSAPSGSAALPGPSASGSVHSAPIVVESAGAGEAAAPHSAAPPSSPGADAPSSSHAAPPSPGPAGHAAPPPPAGNATIIYTDAEGNPVDPPPDPALVLPQILELINQLQFQEALDLAELLLEKAVLDKEQKEEALHIRAEMLFAVHKEDLAAHYKEISDAASQAMSFNPKSPRNAADLLRLGYMNLKLNNIPEAEARFNMLRRQFPNDQNVPLTYYYWGDYHFGRNELQKAADEFQYVLQEFPNSQYARESALGLARSFYRMGYYEQAFNVVDYIERRWERFYIQYPPFLNMMGDVAFRLNKLDFALKHYWLYVNLEPQGEETDIILTRLGDIYAMQREKGAAQELYAESMRRFPDKDGGLVAMMRQAEEGMYDDPTIAGMFAVYDGPFSMRPVEVYRHIIRDYPASSLAPLAQVKLALWHLWNKEYEESLKVLSDFIDKYPKHELVPRASEIAMQAFAVLAAESMQDERYARMREVWEKFPIVHGQGEAMSPESRIALGVSYRQEGKPNEALQAVEPFFLGNKIPEYSEMALSLVLSIYLEHNQWQAVREVARRVELWELKEESARQLDYALALAAENLDEAESAAPIWQKLYDSGKLPPSQMAYASFFLAREAERSRQLEKAFLLGQEALSRLLTQVERNPNPADIGKIQTQLASLMDVAESAGRMNEALRYGEQYLQYLDADSAERLAVRYRMARIYKKQGDSETWAGILREIARAAPDTVYGQLAASELNAASIAEDAAKFSPTGRL